MADDPELTAQLALLRAETSALYALSSLPGGGTDADVVRETRALVGRSRSAHASVLIAQTEEKLAARDEIDALSVELAAKTAELEALKAANEPKEP